jgi:hypothetical protein
VLGAQLIQLAKHKGIRTINVVRRQEQVEELKALGCVPMENPTSILQLHVSVAHCCGSTSYVLNCYCALWWRCALASAGALPWPAGSAGAAAANAAMAAMPNRSSCPLCRADEVINSQTEDMDARVMDITGGQGAYSALDPVAGHTTSQASWWRSHDFITCIDAEVHELWLTLAQTPSQQGTAL